MQCDAMREHVACDIDVYDVDHHPFFFLTLIKTKKKNFPGKARQFRTRERGTVISTR